VKIDEVTPRLRGFLVSLYLGFLYDGWGKNCNEWDSFPAGKARRIFFLPPLLFLVSTSWVPSTGCGRRELLLQHIRFLYWGALSSLVGAPFLKHSEGVFFIICGKTRFLFPGSM
jgi:hypothetical protein